MNRASITELKGYANPCREIVLVTNSVMILLKESEDWATFKKVALNSSTFLKELKCYNKSNLSQEMLQKVNKYVTDPRFQPSVIGSKSQAAKSLCLWVHGLYDYGLKVRGIKKLPDIVIEVKEEKKPPNSARVRGKS